MQVGGLRSLPFLLDLLHQLSLVLQVALPTLSHHLLLLLPVFLILKFVLHEGCLVHTAFNRIFTLTLRNLLLQVVFKLLSGLSLGDFPL